MKTKVLLVSSEAVPYIKTGGLADVVGSLPRFIDSTKFDVRVILPKYTCMDSSFLKELKFVCHFYVDLNWRKQYAGILSANYKGITYYFVDNEFYFGGPHPYGHVYEDVEKFAFFDKAVLMALPYLDFAPQIIHCNDWQTGLVPVFLRTSMGSDPFYAGIKTIFSIHNMRFQGRWKIREIMDITGLPEQIFNASELEAYGEANYLKGGCVYADAITTVSPTYAHDITTQEGGEGLHGLMYARRESLYGILNGLDYEEYNPQTDPYLNNHFDRTTVLEGKSLCKARLQQRLALPVSEKTFLIGMVSRMTDQKGFDLVACVMEEMLRTMDVQFAILGTGEEKYENMFRHFQGRYPGKISAHVGYSEDYAHQIYAGADAFLMPSLFEPCGLSQMMAMRYGTVPIVRETGGLIDTVSSYNEYEHTGTGFSFTDYNAHDMLHVIRYAKQVYDKKTQEWHDIMVRDMEQDFSWAASARKYEELYLHLLD